MYRVFPDYAADPVWNDRGMVDLDTLPVTTGLRLALRAWREEWEQQLGARQGRYEVLEPDAHHRWQRRGRALAAQLQRELGTAADVRYEP